MKKLVLSLAVIFAVGMVSCGGNDKKEACDSPVADTTEVVEAAVVEEEAPATDSPAAEQAPAEQAPAADSAK